MCRTNCKVKCNKSFCQTTWSRINVMKKVAILQSNYIPWKGYFDLIAAVDEFILYDDMQYTRHDWRNRNKIKTPQGLQWLTVHVHGKGSLEIGRASGRERVCKNGKISVVAGYLKKKKK